MYRARVLLWHSKDDRYVQPGETVDFPHLTPEDVEMLIRVGAIEPIAPARQKKQQEVTDDTTVSSD